MRKLLPFIALLFAPSLFAQVQLGGHVYVPSPTDSTGGYTIVTFTADGNCDLVTPVNCTLTTSTGGAAGPDSPYAATLYVEDPGNVLTTTRQIFAPPSPGRIYTVSNDTNQPVGLGTAEEGGGKVVASNESQTFVGLVYRGSGVVIPFYDFSSEATGVTSINGLGGDFTFTGSGVSCSGVTCTFGGGIPTTPNNALVKIDGAGGAASELTDDGTTLNYSGTNFVMNGPGDNQQITGDNVYSWVVQLYGYCDAGWMWCVSSGLIGLGPTGTNYIDSNGDIHLGLHGNVYLDDLTSKPCLGTNSSGLLGTGTGCGASVPLTCTSGQCYRIDGDGTITEFGTCATANTGGAETSCTFTFPHAFTTQVTVTGSMTNLASCVSGDPNTPVTMGVLTPGLASTTLQFAKVVEASAGGGNFNASCNFAWSAVGR
jgi:hypothetical protein